MQLIDFILFRWCNCNDVISNHSLYIVSCIPTYPCSCNVHHSFVIILHLAPCSHTWTICYELISLLRLSCCKCVLKLTVTLYSCYCCLLVLSCYLVDWWTPCHSSWVVCLHKPIALSVNVKLQQNQQQQLMCVVEMHGWTRLRWHLHLTWDSMSKPSERLYISTSLKQVTPFSLSLFVCPCVPDNVQVQNYVNHRKHFLQRDMLINLQW